MRIWIMQLHFGFQLTSDNDVGIVYLQKSKIAQSETQL
jgi:hypothetical protein